MSWVTWVLIVASATAAVCSVWRMVELRRRDSILMTVGDKTLHLKGSEDADSLHVIELFLNAQKTPGALVFNPPFQMRQGREQRVSVGVARSDVLIGKLVAQLGSTDSAIIENIQTSAMMQVELQGSAFEITSLTPTEQIVASTAIWRFNVIPLVSGTRTLTVTAMMRLQLPAEQEGTMVLPAVERSVRVEVDVPYRAKRFVSAHWQWLVGTTIAAAGAVIAWLGLYK